MNSGILAGWGFTCLLHAALLCASGPALNPAIVSASCQSPRFHLAIPNHLPNKTRAAWLSR